MRVLVAVVLSGVLAGSGCAGHKTGLPLATNRPDPKFSELPTPSPATGNLLPPPPPKLIITPENALTGKVVSSNAIGRFVVLNFPVGHLPAIDQQLEVYRLGLKVGEVKVTGPQNDDSIVADIMTGEVVAGDVVRDR